MQITFYHPDGRKPLIIIFKNIPELGDKIQVDGKDAWIITIGKQVVGVDLEYQWHGQYTFDRSQYFR